jgi:hypothetical protein
MNRRTIRRTALAALLAGFLCLTPPAGGVPAPTEKQADVIADRAGFIPQRKHLAVPGKIVAVLLTDAQPVLSTEGRSGPADQLCIGWSGGSYRWVYVPVAEKAMIQNLQVPLPEGKLKVYPTLSMASPTTVKKWGIDSPYALVEVEVNDGEGSPANDSFVATKMTRLDKTKDVPLDVAAAVAEARKQYETHLSEKAKDLDAAMDEAAKKAIKDRKPTGPRDKATLMFVTWLPDAERLVVRFRTHITDGDYKYGNGINIELPAPPVAPAPPRGGAVRPPLLENGLRYGTQFGIEYGAQFEYTKAGKLDRVKTLAVESFTKELPMPPMIGRPRPIPLPVVPIKPAPPVRPLPVDK